MEDEEGGEEEVEDIVGREHGQDLSRLYAASYQCLICQIVVLWKERQRYLHIKKHWMPRKHWMLDKTGASKNPIDSFSSAAAAAVNWLYLDV